MANPNNHGNVVGNLAADPVYFVNDNGTKRVFLTVYARRNCKSKTTRQREADPIRLEAWVRAETEGIGIFEHAHRGDLVNVQYSVRAGEYPDKATGEVIYFQQLHVEDIQLLDSLATSNARLARRLGAQQGPQEATPAPEPTEVPQAAPKATTRRTKVAQPA